MAQKKPANSTEFPEFQSFVNARGRPAVFLFLTQSMSLAHALQLRSALNNRKFEELDLVIHSGGGDINAAYQIVTLLRMHTNKLIACVPFFAKSAATLLCVGADTIVLDEMAQLGPLDAQIYEQERGRGEFTSALNPFKTLEQLQTFAIETLDLSMKMIIDRSGMEVDICLKHATDFVQATTGPLITQLNAEKLGKYSRSLAVGEEYGKRLLQRFAKWDEEKRDQVIERLVHGYPSHEYIIDFYELQEMGFNVEYFQEVEGSAVRGLYKAMTGDQSVIKCLEPEKTPAASGNGEELAKKQDSPQEGAAAKKGKP